MAALQRAPIATIVAGGGYGKTTLAIEYAASRGIAWALVRLEPGDDIPEVLVARIRSALARAGLSDAADALEPGEGGPDEAVSRLLLLLSGREDPLLLVLDEVGSLGAEGGALVARLGVELPPVSGLVLVGRTLPAALAPLAAGPSTIRLGQAELAFSTEETEALLARAGVERNGSSALRLRRAADGWPVAIQLAATRLAQAPDTEAELDRLESAPILLAGLVDVPLEALAPDARVAVIQLAHLPDLTAEIAARATEMPGIVDVGLAAGIPFDVTESGRIELPDPVREVLVERGRLSPEVARRAAEAYVEHGHASQAVRLLVAAGDAERAAATSAALSPQAVSRLDVQELRALLSSIPDDALDRHPRALMHLARACEASAERGLRTDLLRRVTAVGRDDPGLQREVAAEVARDLVRDGQVEAARETAERLLAEASRDELQTRVRALHVLGRAHAWSGEPSGLAAAEPLLEEAVELYGRLGFHTARAHALLALAYDVHTLGGRFDAALEALERALAGLPARSRLRGVVLVFQAEALIDLGRLLEAEASLLEAERLGALFGDTRTLGYTGWLRARAAASLGDAARVRTQLVEAERHRGEWFDHQSGAEFLAEASILLGQVGELEPAAEYLRRALERVTEAPRYVRLAEGAFEARHGDPDRAESILAEVAARPDLDVRESWRPALLRALAAHRSGEQARAAERAGESFALAGRAGMPELPLRREPEVATMFLSLIGTASDDASMLERGGASITVLGRFEVRRSGALLSIPPGRPEALVKLLSVNGGRLPVDAVIEALWPGVEESSGRKRLRNVLNRLRDAAGDLVVREGDLLAFDSGTDVDVVLFEQAARAAFAEPDAGLSQARAALSLYAGEVLPDDRYQDWATEPRERVRARALGLLDLLASHAERDGDLDEALRLLERGIEVDRLDESRYVRSARLLLRQGRRGRALEILRASAAALRDLGLDPSDEHRALVRSARA